MNYRKMAKIKLVIIFFINMGFALSGIATNYYCNPSSGNINNEGTKSNPWPTLGEVLNRGKTFVEGDSIFLFSGNHGEVNVQQFNLGFVVVSTFDNEKPIISTLIINSSSFWKFIGIDIAKEAPASNYNVYSVSDQYFLIQTDKNSNNISFEGCNIYTVGVDVENWGRLDWFTGTLSGLMLRSKYTIVNNCKITNTNFSIEVHGRYTEVTNCIIENFVGDAIRALSSFSSYEYNIVKNSYDITGYDDNSAGQNPAYPVGGGNHDDLFQSYTSSVGGTEYNVTDVIVRHNKFYSYTDANQVDKSYTQGIALFDGFFNNWIIENNLIVTDSWHGITMLGVNDAVIANNTILDNPIDNDLQLGNGAVVNDMTPFIWVGKTKDGQKSYDNSIRNNLIIQSKFSASGYKNIIDEAENTAIDNNHTISTNSESDYFLDHNSFNFLTKENSPAIDKGINVDLLVYDLNNQARLIGTNVDCGAYEYDNSSDGNNCPVISPVENQTVKQYQTLELKIEATDVDGSSISMNIEPLEGFMTFVDYRDGTGILAVMPIEGHVGDYKLFLTVSDDRGNTNQLSFMVTVEYGTSGLMNEYENNLIKLYPNPVRSGETLFVEINDSFTATQDEVKVYTISGKLVLSVKPSNINRNIQINTSKIGQKGIYIIGYNGYNKLISIQ